MNVSIPSRGSGKGDRHSRRLTKPAKKFQSPLGEVVKETTSVPLTEQLRPMGASKLSFNPLSGKW